MFVILFNGPPSSGKDTAAGIMTTFFTKNGIRAAEFKFAHMLKKGLHESLALSIPVNAFEGQAKDEPSSLFFGLTPRQAYIKHSEDYMKKVYGESVFGTLLVRQLEAAARKGITVACISDCGFEVEVNCVIVKYSPRQCALFRMHRIGCDFKNDSRSYLKNGKVASVDIKNDASLSHLTANLHNHGDVFMRQRNSDLISF